MTGPDTLHYGEEKSRNDFGDEDVGAVLGCIDPGDDHVRDLLARLADAGTVEVREGAGDHGANVCRAPAGLNGPEEVDLSGETRNGDVWGHYTFAFRTEPATPARSATIDGPPGPEAGGRASTADARGSDPPE